MAVADVVTTHPPIGWRPVGLPLYKYPICEPDVGKVEEVWLTVVEPVKVGEEHDNPPQVTVPEVLITPQLEFWYP